LEILLLKKFLDWLKIDDIFQVLIGVDVLARMKIVMDFSDHTLYQKNRWDTKNRKFWKCERNRRWGR